MQAKLYRWLYMIVLLWTAPGHAGGGYPMQAEQVAPDVYAIITPTRELPNPQNRGWNSNSAFVVTGDGVLLFDSGSSVDIGRAIRNTIAGVTDQPVRWIINSHAHGDHWLGNAAFKHSVEQIYASPRVRQAILIGGSSWVDRFKRMTAGATGDSEILLPTATIEQRQTLLLGNKTIEVFASGDSHSPGDLLLWLPQQQVLISGDVVYSDRMPSTNASNLAQWIGTLKQLQELQPAVVIPGPGAVADIEALARLEKLLTALWQAVSEAYEDGLSDFEMLPRVQQALDAFADDYPGLEQKLKRDLSHVFLQVEAASF